MSDAELGPRLAAYLKSRHDRAVEIVSIARIHGGASRETYRVRMIEGGRERGAILRRDPVSALIDTERDVEFAAYRAFFPVEGVPVPEPIALELDASHLDRPFFLMEEIEGCVAGGLLSAEPYGPHAAAIGEQFWTTLGRIAAADPRAGGIGWDAPAPDQAWARELAKWEAVIDEDEREPQPIARAAIRRLRRNPPPPARRIAMVHGDYRTGNFLHDGAGTIRAILDWEMAHLGDPLEDLAWALDPLWHSANPERPGGMIAKADAIALWERETGMTVDVAALAWWEMFASLKGLAIWISAAREVHEGTNADPVNVFSGWFCYAFHNQRLAHLLEGGAP